jgi:hypothetical protein
VKRSLAKHAKHAKEDKKIERVKRLGEASVQLAVFFYPYCVLVFLGVLGALGERNSYVFAASATRARQRR